MKRTLTLLLALAGICHSQQGGMEKAAPPAKENFHIYLLMGQSNMAGRDCRELDKQETDPRVLAMTPEGEWHVAKDPLHQQDGRTLPGAGPGIPFAMAMARAEPGVTIGLVPCAVGGSPMKRWVKKGDLYERAMERAALAAKAGTIRGVIWHQGETDTTREAWADAYAGRLEGMIGDLRKDLGERRLPVVVGQIGGFLAERPDKYPGYGTVRDAIRAVAGKVPGVGYADSEGLGHQGDKLHFDTAAQREIGGRFAEAMLGLRK